MSVQLEQFAFADRKRRVEMIALCFCSMIIFGYEFLCGLLSFFFMGGYGPVCHFSLSFPPLRVCLCVIECVRNAWFAINAGRLNFSHFVCVLILVGQLKRSASFPSPSTHSSSSCWENKFKSHPSLSIFSSQIHTSTVAHSDPSK